MPGGIIFSNVLGNVGLEHPFAFPHYEVGGIGRIDDVNRVYTARIFLTDPLEHALGAGALHAHVDTRISRLERFGDALRNRQQQVDAFAEANERPREELIQRHRLSAQPHGVLVGRQHLAQLVAEHRPTAGLEHEHRHTRSDRLIERVFYSSLTIASPCRRDDVVLLSKSQME